MKSPQSSFQCPYMKRKQDYLKQSLYSTWRYPVSCIKDRLRYSLCSICMNQTGDHYPYEYMPRVSFENGWTEPSRHGRVTANLQPNNQSIISETHKKEGAVLCFGKDTQQ